LDSIGPERVLWVPIEFRIRTTFSSVAIRGNVIPLKPLSDGISFRRLNPDNIGLSEPHSTPLEKYVVQNVKEWDLKHPEPIQISSDSEDAIHGEEIEDSEQEISDDEGQQEVEDYSTEDDSDDEAEEEHEEGNSSRRKRLRIA
jgi:hypothetical protein